MTQENEPKLVAVQTYIRMEDWPRIEFLRQRRRRQRADLYMDLISIGLDVLERSMGIPNRNFPTYQRNGQVEHPIPQEIPPQQPPEPAPPPAPEPIVQPVPEPEPLIVRNDMAVKDLALNLNTKKALYDAGVTTVSQLYQMSNQQLLAIKGISTLRLNEIQKAVGGIEEPHDASRF